MLDLPVRAGVCYGGLVDMDVIFIVELEELLPGELHVIVHDDGVGDSKAMDNVHEEQHNLLGFDHGDRLSLYPLRELVHDDK